MFEFVIWYYISSSILAVGPPGYVMTFYGMKAFVCNISPTTGIWKLHGWDLSCVPFQKEAIWNIVEWYEGKAVLQSILPRANIIRK